MRLEQDEWWEPAPDGWICDQIEGDENCDALAKGVLYYLCGDPDCCAAPVYFLCEKHLAKVYGEI